MIRKALCSDGSFLTVQCPVCRGTTFDEHDYDSQKNSYVCLNCGRIQEFNQPLLQVQGGEEE